MKLISDSEALDPSEEIAALVRQLHEAQRRLHELTGGEVDAVIDPGGQPYLLWEAQERLRSSEAAQRQFATRQSLILNTLPAHIAFIDQQGVIVSVNERWSRFGQENSLNFRYRTVGGNYLKVCDDAQGPDSEGAQQSAAGIRAVLQGSAREFSFEYPCHSPTENRWFRLVVNPLEGDGIGGAVVMHVDITDRYKQEQQRLRAETALRASEKQFSSAFEFAAIGMALVATGGRFLKVNRALCQMLGYSESDLLERTYQDITYHEDLEADLENVAKALAGEIDSYQMEKRYHHALGNIVSAQLSASLVHYDEGAPLHFISQIQDITEQVRSREALRMQAHMLDHIGQAVIATDPSGLVIYANRFAGDLYGWLPAEMLGRQITELTVPTDVQEEAEGVMSSLKAGDPWSGEFLVRDRSERIFPAHVTNSPLFDSRAELIGIVGISSDITERKKAEHALRSSEERAHQISAHLAKVLDSSLDAICTFDEHGQFLQVSAASDSIWGYSPAELIGTSYMEKVFPDDQQLTRTAAAGIMAGNPTNNFENRYVRKDGSIAYITWSAWWSEADRSMFCVARDNTEAYHSKEETRQLAERLTTTLESITDAFFMIDPAWRFTYVNAQGEKMLDHPRAALIGQPMWSTFPDLKGTAFQRECERAIQDQAPIQLEIFSQPLNGWLEARAYPSSQGLAVYLRDISKSRRAREELRISGERFRLLAKATNDAIWDWNIAQGTAWWNEGLETLFGYCPQEMSEGRESWSTFIHPDDAASVRDHLSQTIKQGKTSFLDEYRFLRKDGSYAHVLERGHLIHDAAGNAVRMIGGITDLSDRIKSQQRIAEQAALIDQAHDAIIVRDLGQKITFWNKGAEMMYGWSSDEACGRSFAELLHPDAVALQRVELELGEKGEWAGELYKATKAGKKVTVNCRWTLLRDEQGRPKSYLHIDTDITEHKKIEQQFLRAQRMESIGTLAGGIAHDLNNVLGPIILSLDIMQMRFNDPESLELISIIEASAKRGADMVSQVLSFARGVEGERIEVQIKHVLHGIEKIANDTFLKHIQVRTSTERELWLVSGDPTQLHQVLLNLCVNARDAMPDGGTLTLSAENRTIDPNYAGLILEANPGPYVLIQVEDSGTGMQEDIIEKIFDPFFTTKELGKGTGLGLSTSLAIVKSHGGFVRVDSQVGRGTKFEVYIPARTGPASAEAPARELEMPRGCGETILVVDDEDSVRKITKQTLEAFGYRVTLACDGVEAIAAVAREGATISAVITDMMMPIMDGPATIQVLRKMNPHLPVIAASGLAAKTHIAKVTSLGVQHFLSKPYTTEKLLQLLKKLLTEKRSGVPSRDDPGGWKV